MNETLKYIILFIVTFILYSTITSSTYIFSIINSLIMEQQKQYESASEFINDYVLPPEITNFIDYI